MTDQERAIITAYTGYTMLTGDRLNIFYKYLNDIMGRPIYTHELATRKMWDAIHEASKDDFIKLCKGG